MGTLTHLRSLYSSAFQNCKPEFLVIVLKGYSAFCAIMISMALYAFIYRAFTGFEF